MASNESPLIGRVLAGRYRLDARRGAAPTSALFVGVDLELDRPVAVKLIHPDLVDRTFRDRFAADAQAAAGLDHPNIVRIEDWGEELVGDRPTTFVVLDHLSGGSLRELLDRGRLLTPSQALVVGLDACRGLDYAHRRGVIHGGVHPGSLLFGADRRARITEFGLSRAQAEVAWGDPDGVDLERARYAAPEVARGGPLTDKADVYGLCLSLIEAVTGQVPFATDSVHSSLQGRIDRLMPVSADLGPLAAVLERAGRPDPAERSSAAELGRALVAAAERLPRPAPIPIVGGGLFGDPSGPLERPPVPVDPLEADPSDADPSAADPSDVDPATGPAAAVVDEPAGHDEDLGPALAAATAVGLAAGPRVDAEPDPSPPLPSSAGADPVGDALDEPTQPIVTEPTTPYPVVPGLGPPAGEPVAAAGPPPPPTVFDDADDDGGQPPRRRTWRRVLGWAIVVIALAAAAVLGVLVYRAVSTKSHDVPDLVGTPESQALNEIAGFDWEVVRRESRSDEPGIEAGDVISTDPTAGTSLDEGDTLVMVVSLGPVLHPLVDVAGLPVETARDRIEGLDLVVGPVTEQFDEEVPAGTVISWSVPAQPSATVGTEVPTGELVALVVSKGPEPRTVPDLIGLTPEQAIAALQQLGLNPVRDPDIFSEVVDRGEVAAMSVQPGTQLPRGSEVRFVASKGPDVVTMPFLAGLDFNAVQQAIVNAGLQVGTVTGNPAGTLLSANANGGVLQGGQLLRRNTVIDLVYTP